MAIASCLGSLLESADRIVCGSYHACDSIFLRQIEKIYIIDQNDDISNL